MAEFKLSKRTQRISSYVDPAKKASKGIQENLYHKTKNPKGIVDMNVAQNTLISDVVLNKLHEPKLQLWDETMLKYSEKRGSEPLRAAIASFLSDQADSPQPLDPEKMCIMNGVRGLIHILSFVLFDEGDTIMCPAPMYYSIPRVILSIANLKTYPIELSSQAGPNGTEPFELTTEHLENALVKATNEGHRVRGVLFVNPINPVGLVYTKDQVISYLRFCKRHDLQALMDEIYMCSIHDEDTKNSSVLGLPQWAIPDPMRTHFLYGFSKDFGMPGAPLSVLYTWNSSVLNVCIELNDFHQASSFIQTAVTKMLRDKAWLRNVYFPTNLSRMRDACQVTMDALDDIGVTYVKPRAGLFIWANFSKFLAEDSVEGEEDFTRHVLECGVGISPSEAYRNNEYGWYRVIFTLPRETLLEGLKRLKGACLTFHCARKTQHLILNGHGDGTIMMNGR